MLIYEKLVVEKEPQRKLFGTENNIPSDEDTEVTYKDADGEAIEDVSDYKYFYEKGKKIFASVNTNQVPDEANDIEVSAWVGEECIAGEAPEEEEKDNGKNKGATKSDNGGRKAGAVEQEEFTITFAKPRSVTVIPKSGTTFHARYCRT